VNNTYTWNQILLRVYLKLVDVKSCSHSVHTLQIVIIMCGSHLSWNKQTVGTMHAFRWCYSQN